MHKTQHEFKWLSEVDIPLSFYELWDDKLGGNLPILRSVKESFPLISNASPLTSLLLHCQMDATAKPVLRQDSFQHIPYLQLHAGGK